jgi:hypothetical protein
VVLADGGLSVDTPLARRGSLTGDAAKTVLEAPATGVQFVVPANGLSVYNADTVAHDFTFQVNPGGTPVIFWKEAGVAAGTHVVLPKKIVLDADTDSLEVLVDADASTTEPTFDLAAVERS